MMDNNQNEIYNVNIEHENGKIEMFNIFEDDKKNKFSGKNCILVLLGILIVVAIVIGIYYLLAINNPKTYFIKASNTFFESIKESIDDAVDFSNHSYLYEGNIKIDTNVDEYSFLNNQKYNYSLGLDLNKEKLEAGIELLENDSKVLNLNSNIKDDNVYLDLGALFNKAILIDSKTLEENTGLSIKKIFEQVQDIYSDENIESINYIINKFNEITNKALEKVEYESSKENIEINGSNIKTNKISLNIDYENFKLIALTFIDEMLSDDKLLNKICQLGELDKEELINNIKNIREEVTVELTEEETSGNLFKVSIYTAGLIRKIVKLELEDQDGQKLYYASLKDYKILAGYDFVAEIKADKLLVKEAGEVVVEGTIKSLENNNINIELSTPDKKVVASIVYTSKDNKNEIKFKVESNEQFKTIFDFTINSNKVNDKEINTDMVFNIKVDSQNIKIENTTKTMIDTVIANIKTDNIINYNNLTEQNFEEIKRNFITSHSILSAASQALSLIFIDSSYIDYTKVDSNTYCFTIENLANAGLIPEKENYKGIVMVTKNNNSYNYSVELMNDLFFVKSDGDFLNSQIKLYTNNNVNIRTSCMFIR